MVDDFSFLYVIGFLKTSNATRNIPMMIHLEADRTHYSSQGALYYKVCFFPSLLSNSYVSGDICLSCMGPGIENAYGGKQEALEILKHLSER